MSADGYGRCPEGHWAFTVATPTGAQSALAIHFLPGTGATRARCRGSYKAPLEVKPLGPL